MNKILKLTGVSMLAIMAAANANAAGYTCEELVEYTSCNPGYYLNQENTGSYTCPQGFHEAADICIEGEWVTVNHYNKDICHEDGGTFYAKGCVNESETSFVKLQPVLVSLGCETCPNGYTCDGGTTRPYVGACEPGYTKHTLCPSGTRLITSACIEMGTLSTNEDINSKEDCLEAGWEWGENICANYDDEIIPQLVAGVTCGKCPAGYLCAGGNTAAVTCPAGSYCATAGASVATGKCNIGTYSTGGATTANCTACPATGLTDINGAVVNATTLSTGAESISACIVGPDALFKDNAGIYHFKSNCEYGLGKLTWETTISSAEECEMLADQTGLDWQWNYDNDECQVYAPSEEIKSIVTLPQTESDCAELGGAPYWEDGKCIIDDCSIWYFADYGFSCE